MGYGFGSYSMSGLFGGGSMYSLLGDYSSIRSGAYKKLLTSYYAATGSGKNSGTSNAKNVYNPNAFMSEQKTATAKKDAAELVKSAGALTAKGSKSLFQAKKTYETDAETGEKKAVEKYDMDAIANSVKSFVSDYNAAVKAGMSSGNTSIQRNIGYMTSQTGIYARSLSQVGITIGADNTLSLNEGTLKKADMDTLKRVFNDSNSFAAQTASRARNVQLTAAAPSTYGRTGSYNNFYGGYSGGFNWYL